VKETNRKEPAVLDPSVNELTGSRAHRRTGEKLTRRKLLGLVVRRAEPLEKDFFLDWMGAKAVAENAALVNAAYRESA
jgi:hypothetical protein